MKKNAFIAILVLAVIVLVANLFRGWFTLSKNDRIVAESSLKHDTVYIDKWLNPKDSTTHGTYRKSYY